VVRSHVSVSAEDVSVGFTLSEIVRTGRIRGTRKMNFQNSLRALSFIFQLPFEIARGTAVQSGQDVTAVQSGQDVTAVRIV
jgi:hypothetical protein